jgi:hypothetical protein
MTQELKPITRGAQELRKLLEEHGSIAKADARDWLAEQDPELTPSTINFVIGHGESLNRNWWHEDAEGFLVKGPKPGKIPEESPSEVPVGLSDELKKPALLDPSAMSEPRDQFYTIALNLGISEKAARITAFSCWSTGDMFNAAEAWQAIVQSTALIPSHTKSLWRNWCAWAGIEIPKDLVEKVEKQYAGLTSTDRSKDSAVAPAPSRRFIAVKGDVVMVEPDDPGGMSFSEALRMADQQARTAAPAQNDNGVVVALINQSGENQRAAQQESGQNMRAFLELSKGDSGGLGPLLIANLDNQRRETELRFQNLEEMRRKDDELARQKEEHRWSEAQDREDRRQENLTKALQELSSNRKGPFDAIEEIAPGFMQRMVDNLLNPPRQEAAFRVTIGDQEGNLSLDDYERYSKIQNQKEFLQFLRKSVPEFFEMGKDFALATRRVAERDRKEQLDAPPDVSLKDPPFNAYCGACYTKLVVRGDIKEFTCPYCGALQSMEGEILTPEVAAREERELQPESPLEESADYGFDAEALVLRAADKDREWSPELEESPAPAAAEPVTQLAGTVGNA